MNLKREEQIVLYTRKPKERIQVEISETEKRKKSELMKLTHSSWRRTIKSFNI